MNFFLLNMKNIIHKYLLIEYDFTDTELVHMQGPNHLPKFFLYLHKQQHKIEKFKVPNDLRQAGDRTYHKRKFNMFTIISIIRADDLDP